MITMQGGVYAEKGLKEAWGAGTHKNQKDKTESCSTNAFPSQEMKW